MNKWLRNQDNNKVLEYILVASAATIILVTTCRSFNQALNPYIPPQTSRTSNSRLAEIASNHTELAKSQIQKNKQEEQPRFYSPSEIYHVALDFITNAYKPK
jgi:hypothetical protein